MSVSIKTLWAQWKAFIGKSNPHNVTPAQLDSYSKAEIDSSISELLLEGIIPLSKYGDTGIGSHTFGFVDNTIKLKAVDTMIAGYYKRMPAFDIKIPEGIDGFIFGQDFYVYVILVQGVISYDVTAKNIADSFTRMKVATFNYSQMDQISGGMPSGYPERIVKIDNVDCTQTYNNF